MTLDSLPRIACRLIQFCLALRLSRKHRASCASSGMDDIARMGNDGGHLQAGCCGH